MTKEYKVTISARHPAAGETNGTEYVFAATAKEACAMVRFQLRNNGYTRQDGGMKITAEKA